MIQSKIQLLLSLLHLFPIKVRFIRTFVAFFLSVLVFQFDCYAAAAIIIIISVMIMIVIDLAILSVYIKKHKYPLLFSCKSDCCTRRAVVL
jgi:hypothetical protein